MNARTHLWTLRLAAGILGGMAVAAAAEVPSTSPAAQNQLLAQASIDQKLGAQVPLDLTFRDEAGKEVRLQDYFGRRPVVLVMAYYECPMLCTLVLNGLTKALNVLELQMGQDYEVVTVSIDPGETPALAAAKKNSYVKELRRAGGANGWHFLTGSQESITPLAEAIGFRYAYDAAQDQYAHASGIMVATPDGVLSKYFYGVEYSARDLRFGLVDAGARRIGTPVDQVLLWCFHYDPVTGRYGFAIMGALRVAGAMTVAAGVFAWIAALRRERRKAHTGAAA